MKIKYTKTKLDPTDFFLIPTLLIQLLPRRLQITLAFGRWGWALNFMLSPPIARAGTWYTPYPGGDEIVYYLMKMGWIIEIPEIEVVIAVYDLGFSYEVQLYNDATFCESRWDVEFDGLQSIYTYRDRESVIAMLDSYFEHIRGAMHEINQLTKIQYP